MASLKKSGSWIRNTLFRPLRVLCACATLATTSLLVDGSLLNIYGLKREEKALKIQIQQNQEQVISFDAQLKKAQDPTFIARQAVDRYDLADENDLVFVFADE